MLLQLGYLRTHYDQLFITADLVNDRCKLIVVTILKMQYNTPNAPARLQKQTRLFGIQIRLG
jgi:hypothetical protein